MLLSLHGRPTQCLHLRIAIEADRQQQKNMARTAKGDVRPSQQGGSDESKDRWYCRDSGNRVSSDWLAARTRKIPRAAAAIDASLRGAVERKDVPGVVALVTDRQRVLYQGAFGVADVSSGRALTTDALFRIASMTKAITSTALMQLVEQGRIALDDPAEKYLPELVGLKVFRIVRRRDRSVSTPPGVKGADRPALPDAHVRAGLSVHQRDLARLQAEGRRNISLWRALAVRSRRALALQHEHGCGRQAGRGRLRPEARRVLPSAHLRAAEDGRHLLQRARGQGAAPRRPAAACRRQDGRRDRSAIAAAWCSPFRRRSAAAASPRRRATTAASCACS